SLRKLTVTYNDKDQHIGRREGEADFQWVTNFIIQPGYYAEYNDKALVGYDRYNIMYDELLRNGAVFEDELSAMKLLQKVAQRTIRPDRKADDRVLTIHSVIYNLDDLSTLWCGNEQYSDVDGMFKYKYNPKKKLFDF
ncbi:MAG: hypothetical protein IKR64_02480, partial [Treponema sp.]|nr:hypothetical protein [Treponema sp.]